MRKTSYISAVIALILAGCGATTPIVLEGGSSLIEGETVYTLTNLHPDPTNNRLYSINYQQPGFIPRCTKVDIVSVKSSVMEFATNDRTYAYYYHKASGDFAENIKKYFGSSCDNNIINGLGETDRQGIEEGKAKPGMTKQGVILAIGYPPQHQTPSTDSNSWRYWSSRFNTFIVEFDSAGNVTKIVN